MVKQEKKMKETGTVKRHEMIITPTSVAISTGNS